MFKKSTALALMMVFSLSSAMAINPKRAKSVIPFFPEVGMDVGYGIDIGTSEVMGKCVEHDGVKQVADLRGQKVKFSFLKIENKDELIKEVNISASAALKSTFFKVEGKSKYFEEIKINQYSLYYLVKLDVLNNTNIIQNPRLTKSAWDLLQSKGTIPFIKKCGQEFINTYTSGGRFYALIEIKTKDQSDLKQIEAQFNGSLIANKTTVGVSFQTLLRNISSSRMIYINMYAEGGGIKNSSDPDKILDLINEFNENVFKGFAVPIIASTTKYERIDLPTEITPMDTYNQQDVLDKLVEYRNKYLQNLDNVDYILKNQNQFVEVDIVGLNKTANLVRSELNKLKRYYTKCIDNYTQCVFPEDLTYPEMHYPKRVAGSAEEFCKDPIYKEKSDPICGVKTYKWGSGEVCGVLRYKRGSGEVCGPLLFRNSSSEACGGVVYNEKADYSCGKEYNYIVQEYDPGYRNCIDSWGRINISTDETYNNNIRETYFPKNQWTCDAFDRVHRVMVNDGDYRVLPYQSNGQTICTNKSTGHQWILCKGDKPLKCRKPEFGIERTDSCRHPSHGVEVWNTCEDKSFGVETYASCAHPSFGPEEYKTCRNKDFGFEKCGNEF
ncbi:MAG: hypothetical protein U0T83_06675 [Bacteriovoracaceae bacterium]